MNFFSNIVNNKRNLETDNYYDIFNDTDDKRKKSLYTDSNTDSESSTKNINEEKIENKQEIIKYIILLYKFLGKKYCFTYGSFVIEDNNSKLYNLLFDYRDVDLSFYKLESHTKFKEPDEKMYEINFPFKKYNFSISCICDDGKEEKRIIQNLKFYNFNQNNSKFVYIKLEDYPTKSLLHAKKAILRYIIGKENKSCKLVRREDCKKNNSCINKDTPNPLFIDNVTTDEYKKKTTYEKINIDNIICDITDKHERVGDEIFVPQCINDYFFDGENVKNPDEIQFTQVENHLIISKTTQTHPTPFSPTQSPSPLQNGGIRMKKKIWKTRKNKKTTKKSIKKKSRNNKKKSRKNKKI